MNNIKHIRETLKLNKSQFAKAIGVSRMSLKRWEERICNPKPMHAWRIVGLAHKLGLPIVNLDEVFGRDQGNYGYTSSLDRSSFKKITRNISGD